MANTRIPDYPLDPKDYCKPLTSSLHDTLDPMVHGAEIKGNRTTQQDELFAGCVPQFADLPPQDIEYITRRMFDVLEKEIEAEPLRSKAYYSGSTLTIAILYKHNLYINWVGDSPAFRIRVNAETHAIEIYQLDKLHTADPRLGGSLALSKAMGDLSYEQFGLSHIPDFSHIELKPEEENHLVIACDGLIEPRCMLNGKLGQIIKKLVKKKEKLTLQEYNEIFDNQTDAAAQAECLVDRLLESDKTPLSNEQLKLQRLLSVTLLACAKTFKSRDNISVAAMSSDPELQYARLFGTADGHGHFGDFISHHLATRVEAVLNQEIQYRINFLKKYGQFQAEAKIDNATFEKYYECYSDMNKLLDDQTRLNLEQGKIIKEIIQPIYDVLFPEQLISDANTLLAQCQNLIQLLPQIIKEVSSIKILEDNLRVKCEEKTAVAETIKPFQGSLISAYKNTLSETWQTDRLNSTYQSSNAKKQELLDKLLPEYIAYLQRKTQNHADGTWLEEIIFDLMKNDSFPMNISNKSKILIIHLIRNYPDLLERETSMNFDELYEYYDSLDMVADGVSEFDATPFRDKLRSISRSYLENKQNLPTKENKDQLIKQCTHYIALLTKFKKIYEESVGLQLKYQPFTFNKQGKTDAACLATMSYTMTKIDETIPTLAAALEKAWNNPENLENLKCMDAQYYDLKLYLIKRFIDELIEQKPVDAAMSASLFTASTLSVHFNWLFDELYELCFSHDPYIAEGLREEIGNARNIDDWSVISFLDILLFHIGSRCMPIIGYVHEQLELLQQQNDSAQRYKIANIETLQHKLNPFLQQEHVYRT